MAVALERAKFDLIMLGDSLAVPGTYQGRMDAYLRYAEHAPFHDPSPLVAIMAAVTRRIGLAVTLSTTFYPPFLLARLMTTLDHLSRGRVAWNVVTSYKHEEALNFGYHEMLEHDQRYDRADEYLELCYQLWASWTPDAVVMDQRTDTFADPAKVRAIDFEGTYYRSRGPLNATPSPQRRPVIVQAGTSERGQEFAARHAEAIIVGRETPEEMKRFYDAFKARCASSDERQRSVSCSSWPSRSSVLPTRQPSRGPTSCTPTRRSRPAWRRSRRCCRSIVHLRARSAAARSLQRPATQGIRSQLDKFYVPGRTQPCGRSPPARSVSTPCHSLAHLSALLTAWRAPSRRSAAMALPSGRVSGRATLVRS